MRSNIRIFLCLCLISAGNIGFGQSKEIDIIKEFVSDPSLAGASAGIMVYDPVSGESLLGHNATTLLAPASVLKLVTSASALEMLGPEYHFKTIFGFCGRVDSISGILQGNLVVKGGGDPTLGSQWFKDQIPPDAFVTRWLATLKRRGVKKISGNLLIDVSAFDGYNVPGSWSWEDIGNYYGAVPSALTYSDNMVRLFFDSPQLAGAPTVLVRTEPETPGITWVNEVKSSPVNRDLAYVYGAPWGEKRKITGTIPCGRKDFLVKASMPEPPLHFGNYVIERLAAYGIKVEGSVVVSNESIEFVVLDYFESPRLADILKPLNQESINLFADHLVFQIALEKEGKGSFETGISLIQRFWKDNGVRDTFFMDDGSGLSRFDAISAEQLTSMLSYMQRSNNAATFRESLPSAGKGTLSGFSVTDFPGNTLQCKSGSINKVRAYAGYLKCDSGRDVAFAILVNNYASGLAEMGRKLQGFLLALRKNL